MPAQFFGVPTNGKSVPQPIQDAITQGINEWSTTRDPLVSSAWQKGDADTLAAARAYADNVTAVLSPAQIENIQWLKSTPVSSTGSLDTLTTPGIYQVPNGTTRGLPVPGIIGVVQVMPLNKATLQMFTQWGTAPKVWWRAFSTAGAPYPWQEISRKADVDGIAARVATLEASKPRLNGCGTKVVPLAITAPGTTVSETTDSGAVRWVRRYAVAPTRVRVHISNRNPANLEYGNDLTVTEVRVGAGDAAGACANSVVVQTGGTIPGSDNELVTPWSTLPVQDGGYIAVTVGWAGGGGTAKIQMLQGGGWRTTDSSQVNSATVTNWTRAKTTPLHVWLEAEVPASTPVVMANGDSISLGTMTDDPVGDAWPAMYSYQQGALPILMGQHGSSMTNWAPSSTRWDMYKGLDRTVVDAVITCLGQNDLTGSGLDLATLKARYADVRSRYDGFGVPVYIAGVTPSTKTPAVEAVRREFNKWLRSLPSGERGYFDFAAAVGDSADEDLSATYSADGLHPNTAGQQRLAQVVLDAPVTPYVPAPSKLKALLA